MALLGVTLCRPSLAVHRTFKPLSCLVPRIPHKLTAPYLTLKQCAAQISSCTRSHGKLAPISALKNLQIFNIRGLTISALNCAKTKGKLPFEVDTNVAKDTLVFSYENTRFFKFLTVFGLAQYLFWVNAATLAYSSFKDMDPEAVAEKIDVSSLWGRLVMYQLNYKYHLSAVFMVVGNIVLFLTLFYPRRSVTQLTLLAGGHDVRLSTYSYFGRTRDFRVPVTHLSCQHARHAAPSQLSLKVKGRWFYHLLDQRKGVFHEPRLFDFGIGLKRDFKA